MRKHLWCEPVGTASGCRWRENITERREAKVTSDRARVPDEAVGHEEPRGFLVAPLEAARVIQMHQAGSGTPVDRAQARIQEAATGGGDRARCSLYFTALMQKYHFFYTK